MPVRRRARLNPGGIEQRDARPEPREPGATEGCALRALHCRTHAEIHEIFVPDLGISLVRYQQDALPQPAPSRRQSALGARTRVCPDGIARRPNLLRISHCHIQDAGTRRRTNGLEAEPVFGVLRHGTRLGSAGNRKFLIDSPYHRKPVPAMPVPTDFRATRAPADASQA